MNIPTTYNIDSVIYTVQDGKVWGGLVFQIKANVYNYGTDVFYLIRDTTTGATITALEGDCFATKEEAMNDFAIDNGLQGCT